MRIVFTVVLGLIALAVAVKVIGLILGLLAFGFHLTMALLSLAVLAAVVLFVVGVVRRMLRV